MNNTKHYYQHPYESKKEVPSVMKFEGKLEGIYKDLEVRCIPKAYCEKWGILYIDKYTTYDKKTNIPTVQPALAFTYFLKDTFKELGGYHIKPLDKDCRILGPIANKCEMYGQHLYGSVKGKTLVITEGHLDCVSCDIACGANPNLHFTSLLNGTGGVSDLIQYHYDRLSQYDNITLAFDMDKPGRKAVDDFLKLFRGNLDRIKIAEYDLKDANEMLMAGKKEDLKWAITMAKPYRPQHIVDKTDKARLDKILEKPEWGKPWPHPDWTLRTYGRYPGMVYGLAADAGMGKTTLVELVLSSLDPSEKAGYLALEEEFERTVQKLLSARMGYNIIRPDMTHKYDKEKLTRHRDELLGQLEFFEPKYGFTLDDITTALMFMINVKKVSFIVVDNLTILAQNTKVDGKRLSVSDYMDEAVLRIRRIAKETNTDIFVIAHTKGEDIRKSVGLATSPIHGESLLNRSKEEWDKILNPPGLSWDSGRKPTSSDIRYGDMLMRLSDWIWVGWRNKNSTDPKEKNTFYMRDAKSRNANPNVDGLIEWFWDSDKGFMEPVVNQSELISISKTDKIVEQSESEDTPPW